MPIIEFTPNADLCPTEYSDELQDYEDYGKPTSSFLEAVLSNELYAAIDRATGHDMLALPHICAWVYVYLPMTIYGSKELVHSHFVAKTRKVESSSKVESDAKA